MNETLLYIGAGVIIIWGIGHLVPTRAIVSGFGDISADNKKVITMELVAEGLTLCFLGVLVLLVTALAGSQSGAAGIVYISCAGMLVVMAIVTALTGARTPVIWYKLCPLVKITVAVLYLLGAIL